MTYMPTKMTPLSTKTVIILGATIGGTVTVVAIAAIIIIGPMVSLCDHECTPINVCVRAFIYLHDYI